MLAKFVSFGIISMVGIGVVLGWKMTARGAYESAEYKVLEQDGQFEIRLYPELTVVTTNSKFQRQGSDGSFMRLFRYISGVNASRQKIAMTTPVFMRRDSDRKSGEMAFVVPKNVAAEGAPAPTGQQVEVRRRVGGRYAVIRFSGRMNADSYQQALKKLRAWIAKRGLHAVGEPESAGYDPPWTPGKFRRNEVLVRIVGPSS